MNSPYSRVGPDLVDMGYSAIPVPPGSKRPGSMSYGKWYGDMDWTRFCDRLPTEIETTIWSRWEDAGVCVALNKVLKVIDVGTDDVDIRQAITAALPDTPVKKKGKKGFSAFYRGSEAIVNRPFNLILPGGFESRVIDLLAHGRQTVLPPTLHPDTGRAYEWITEDTLLDTPIDKLPELPAEVAERLVEALQPFGQVQELKQRGAKGEEVFGNSLWKEVNTYALANLNSWVPALFGEGNYKRQRDGTYRARAFWRGVENFNVGIHPDGIKDWGADHPYTPIDLVMAALCTGYFEPAYEWLVQRTGYDPRATVWHQQAAESAKRLADKYRRGQQRATEAVAAGADPETGELPEDEPVVDEPVVVDPIAVMTQPDVNDGPTPEGVY